MVSSDGRNGRANNLQTFRSTLAAVSKARWKPASQRMWRQTAWVETNESSNQDVWRQENIHKQRAEVQTRNQKLGVL